MEKKVNEVDKNNGKIAKKHPYFEKKQQKEQKIRWILKKKNKKTKTQLNFENSVKMEQ